MASHPVRLPASSSAPIPPLPSSTLWVHSTGIHLHHIYAQTHVHEAPVKTCGVGWNLSTAAGLSVWGRAGYHVHLNKGPVFRQASWETSWAPSLCPALLQCLPWGSFTKTSWVEPHVLASIADVNGGVLLRWVKLNRSVNIVFFLPPSQFIYALKVLPGWLSGEKNVIGGVMSVCSPPKP